MQQTPESRVELSSYLATALVGGGIGWLIGLSVSPVVSQVLAALLGLVATLITALSGLQKPDSNSADNQTFLNYRVSPWPLAALMIGLVIGSIVGIYARNGIWFGSEVSAEARKWSNAGLDMPQNELAAHLFEAQYPTDGQSPSQPISNSNQQSAGLAGAAHSSEQCVTLRNAVARSNDALLVETLAEFELFQHVPNHNIDTELLKRLVKEILCLSEQEH